MECLPSIDLRGGQSVRLLRGEYDAETGYGDPVDQAIRYEKAGAAILHVVDLDAARTGEPTNGEVIAAITHAISIPVEVGGGVRSTERAVELFELGVERVVLGTRAVEDPAFAIALAESHPERVVLGLDHRRVPVEGTERREVATRGWEAGSGRELFSLLDLFEGAPFAAVVATDITVDGTLEGPDLAGYELLLGATAIPVIASGGVGSLDDVAALGALSVSGHTLAGVIIGKALLSGAFSVEEAVAACRP
jgi:phosphoribosylformimino-5-aminoimidazole carboxamide ribotide isomerase